VHIFIRRWTGVLTLGLLVNIASAEQEPWLLIDTEDATLSVIRGDTVVLKLSNISLGRGGTTYQRVRDDNRTPLGKFRVMDINTRSNYYRFYTLNYPTQEHALRAWKDGLIDSHTYHAISEAIMEHRLPPQNTPLGGYLGIHGLGNGDRWIHKRFHWTRGCIALTNQQIDKLAPWIDVGSKVVIN
jgi:murein L,D-transpeptidase YafK